LVFHVNDGNGVFQSFKMDEKENFEEGLIEVI
jgi:hypothetical protein